VSLATAPTATVRQLPSRRDEDWRWTDLRALIRQMPPPSPAAEVVQAGGPFAGLSKAELVLANGRLNWWPEKIVAGVRFQEHESPDNPYEGRLPMAAWAAADSVEPRVSILEFTKNAAALVRFQSASAGTSHHDRLGVVVKAGVSAVLLESHEAEADDYVANRLIEIFLEEGASLERIVVSAEAPGAVTVTTAVVDLQPASRFSQTILTSGARRQRIETHVAHPGQGASVRLDGGYLLQDQRHADTTSVVTHSGLGGVTSQLTKGVVDGQARGVFQGRIVVERGADQTDARMGHHALILSDKAEIDAKPELLIFADDVQCAHGNTVGALDENALFYAQQRGMPFETARAMLTEAFVGEVVDRIEHEGAREIAAAWVAQQLGRGQ
jgi:Fe-S cluster assembly protein SufD